MKRKPLVVLLLTILLLFVTFFITNLNVAKSARLKAGMENLAVPGQAFENYVAALYEHIGLHAKGLKQEVFRKAMIGYLNLKKDGNLNTESHKLTVVDFSIKSTDKRMWVIDLEQKKVLFHTLVSHGKNSGGNYATHFSNIPSSYMSSLGFYLTSEIYTGKHGISLRLDGMDEGFNDNARARAVVIHGADYACEGTAKALGRLGRSFGCPAVPTQISDKLIRSIAGNNCLFIYYPDKKYEASTRYYNLNKAIDSYRYETQLGLSR